MAAFPLDEDLNADDHSHSSGSPAGVVVHKAQSFISRAIPARRADTRRRFSPPSRSATACTTGVHDAVEYPNDCLRWLSKAVEQPPHLLMLSCPESRTLRVPQLRFARGPQSALSTTSLGAGLKL